MQTFNDPVADAEETRQTTRALAHATRSIEDPTTLYPVLGSISAALASLAQTLHQLGDLHDSPAIRRAWLNSDSRTDAASTYRVSSELHRAAELVHQVAAGVDRAHGIEATLAYQPPDPPPTQAADRALRRSVEGPVSIRGVSL